MKTKMTHAEHRANFLAKQVAGQIRIIGDLQEALRIARDRQMRAETEAKDAMMAGDIMEQIARAVIADLPEEKQAK